MPFEEIDLSGIQTDRALDWPSKVTTSAAGRPPVAGHDPARTFLDRLLVVLKADDRNPWPGPWCTPKRWANRSSPCSAAM